jgi:hypothetical protein
VVVVESKRLCEVAAEFCYSTTVWHSFVSP